MLPGPSSAGPVEAAVADFGWDDDASELVSGRGVELTGAADPSANRASEPASAEPFPPAPSISLLAGQAAGGSLPRFLFARVCIHWTTSSGQLDGVIPSVCRGGLHTVALQWTTA